MSRPRTGVPRKRAITDSAKQARRTLLLSAAEKLFEKRDFDDISIDDIARKAGLAKGTVYLYFGTKEGLFLQLVSHQIADWAKQAAEQVGRTRTDPPTLACIAASTLDDRPVLIRLLALLHAVLERNSDADSARIFKRQLLAITVESGEVFDNALGLAPGTGARITLWMHALIVGLAQMTSSSPVLKRVLAEDDTLAVLRLNFRSELESALAALFAGAQVR